MEEIKDHDFFSGMDWDKVRAQKAPYQPSVSSEISAENFDKFEEEEPFYGDKSKKLNSRKIDINFIGYTYKADVENERSMLNNVLKDLDSIGEASLQQQQMFNPKQSPLNVNTNISNGGQKS